MARRRACGRVIRSFDDCSLAVADAPMQPGPSGFPGPNDPSGLSVGDVPAGPARPASDLHGRLRAYGRWRTELSAAVERHGRWLSDTGLSDPQLQARIARMLDRLRDDRMTVAFVAEFSRGKSELINALFFADYGQRVLPSSAGRTTMCPTELLHDPAQPPGIRLLPIETRLGDSPVSELRRDPSAWRHVPFDPADVESLKRAFQSVRQTKRVPVEQAILMGLYDETDPSAPHEPRDGGVEVSRWRHAVANVPHPLLDSGLVIIDTPGLNAVGAEPELTFDLIPGAHAVLFVLAADAGVTRTDIDVWRERINPAHRSGRFVVLNKIDGLWDALRPDDEVACEIGEQVATVARTLQIPAQRVYPVSAQKGLVARVTGDAALLARSRLPELERALSLEIVPQQQAIVREQVRREFDEAWSVTHDVLSARRRNLLEQGVELESLRGRNRAAVEQLARRVRHERASFERGLRRLSALRAVFGRHERSIVHAVAIDRLKEHVREARRRMHESRLSVGLRDAMQGLIAAVRADFAQYDRQVDEVQALMIAMYGSFEREHGLTLGMPPQFSAGEYTLILERIDAIHQKHFGALSLATTEKWALTRRFFESVVARIRDLYERAGRESANWLRDLMAPIEGQVAEHRAQLRRRLESVRRILEASGELESRLGELGQARSQVEQQLADLRSIGDAVRAVLERQDAPAEAVLAAA
jgi:hypothetical protein